MVAENMIWHHSQVVTEHSLYRNFGCELSEISERDYPGRNYITHEIPALDMDSYETSLKGNNDCTVDAVVGICNERQNIVVRGRHLLVELRMNYINMDNLSVAEINQKNVHTRDLLKACVDNIPVDPTLCLLFDNSVENQAVSWVSRKKSEFKFTSNWFSFSPTTFCNYINAGKPRPYTPRPETVQAAGRFMSQAAKNDLELLDKEFMYIRGYMDNCRLRYEKGECEYLIDSIVEGIGRFNKDLLKEEDVDLYEIIKDDVQSLINSVKNWLCE